LAQVTYPDAGIVQYRYNRQGDVTSMTDQNGTTHTYLYDGRGRRTTDQISSVSDPAINLSIRKLVTTFNEKGLVAQSRSFATLLASTPAHSVLFTYNDFNQLSKEDQRHSSFVPPIGSETVVQYAYANGQNNTTRLQSLTYPNGRLIQYSYTGDGDALNRVQAILDTGGQQLVTYAYLGMGDFIETTYVPPSVTSSLVLGSGATPYTALDTFDRLLQLQWQKTGGTPTNLVKLGYTYDTASNRTTIDNQVASSGWDYAFTYDGLHRLATANRGDLTVGGTITNSQLLESWTLDQTGNWGGYQRTVPVGTGLNQSRTHNTANEITGITNQAPPTWIVPTFDNNGNMRLTPKPSDPSAGFTLVWDAWNRLIRVDDGATPVVTHAYDGLGRRILSTPAGQSVRHFYYSSSWQALEERVAAAASADRQYLWGLRYIDDYAFQEVAQAAGPAVRHWGLQDGNWNVVGLVDNAGIVAQRYAYDSYGTVIYLTPGFVTQATPSISNGTAFAGRLLDPVTGIYEFRRRHFLAALGQFASRDPIGYLGNDINLFRYVVNQPTIAIDPIGLATLSDVVSGKLVYSCDCGWIDWSHAGDRTEEIDRNAPLPRAWRDMLLSTGRASIMGGGYKMTLRQGQQAHLPLIGIVRDQMVRNYYVANGLTNDQLQGVLLSAWMDISMQFETHQSHVNWIDFRKPNSGFSNEDLPSDLIYFYRVVKGYPKSTIETLCGALSTTSSLRIWKEMGGVMGHSRTWEPEFENGPVAKCECKDRRGKWPLELSGIEIADQAIGQWRPWKIVYSRMSLPPYDESQAPAHGFVR
jgi:RHS repeat-associated protein